MASLDDESNPLPVTNYYFEDDKNVPISVHVLPLQWGKDNRQNREKDLKYLRGVADNGLKTIHEAVFAWKFDLSVKPVISVLSKRNMWIVLQRPRKSYEKIIRSILVTLCCLSYVNFNPNASATSVWDYLADVCSFWETKPSENDLGEHMRFISEAVIWEKICCQLSQREAQIHKWGAVGSFTCPIHKCCICNQGEDKKDPELQFAVCRCCPTSFHRKCLPQDIPFEKGKEGDEVRVTRAWEGLLPDQVLVYCRKHKLVRSLGTPRRDHVIFPDVIDKKIADDKKNLYQEKRRSTSESLVVSENSLSKRKRLSSEGLHNATTAIRQKMTSAAKVGNHSEHKSAIVYPTSRRSSGPLVMLDPARRMRLDALIKDAAASVKLDDVIRKQRVPSTHVSSERTAAEMNIALRKALMAVDDQ